MNTGIIQKYGSIVENQKKKVLIKGTVAQDF
jgi:hypothetical protein